MDGATGRANVLPDFGDYLRRHYMPMMQEYATPFVSYCVGGKDTAKKFLKCFDGKALVEDITEQVKKESMSPLIDVAYKCGTWKVYALRPPTNDSEKEEFKIRVRGQWDVAKPLEQAGTIRSSLFGYHFDRKEKGQFRPDFVFVDENATGWMKNVVEREKVEWMHADYIDASMVNAKGFHKIWKKHYDAVYKEGYEDGKKFGYRKGKEDGELKARAEGYKQGYEIGRASGRKEGFFEGFEEGFKRAYQNFAAAVRPPALNPEFSPSTAPSASFPPSPPRKDEMQEAARAAFEQRKKQMPSGEIVLPVEVQNALGQIVMALKGVVSQLPDFENPRDEGEKPVASAPPAPHPPATGVPEDVTNSGTRQQGREGDGDDSCQQE
eukprot:CAMPEP_0113918522 /NCGR_PEP_ID=MMETSP0780_2-20120614/33405_1 /TAXON_ID=652834 /ORGANISM="Palpitomonas bilix" /LENGTH=379 /DNA_ID=CAMNT_0000918353 /DNA_START=15 /DNA_END=1154 /DNA_ORIENTATION=+ /assembly_acc=CAM_ASM_000599